MLDRLIAEDEIWIYSLCLTGTFVGAVTFPESITCVETKAFEFDWF